jgi:hypothetical protein
MSESKHTKGPWTFIDHQGYNTIEGQGEMIACIPTREDFRANFKTDEGQANRRLIAAAPEMLEALENLITELNESGAIESIQVKTAIDAVKAIAKARGDKDA